MADIKYTMPQPTEDKDVRSMADIKYTMPPPTEDTEQMCLFRWADAQSGKYPELSLMYHIPKRRQAWESRSGPLPRNGCEIRRAGHLPACRRSEDRFR